MASPSNVLRLFRSAAARAPTTLTRSVSTARQLRVPLCLKQPSLSKRPSHMPIARPFQLSRARLFATVSEEQPRLRLGSEAPNFKAETTKGPIDFHEFIGESWVILFSHPADFTPVCTTELGAFAKLEPEFTKRNVKLIGLSANGLDSHDQWVKDIDEVTGSNLSFPIIADAKREVAWLYDMLSAEEVKKFQEGGIAFTIRSVFVIDPSKKIRLTMTYPASTGRNTAEVLRVVEALQLGDKKGIATPINWTTGQDVIVPPTVSTEDAKKKFGEENVRELKPYLRYTTLKD